MAIKIFKGASIPKSELNAYSVGLLRLQEAHISSENFEHDDIEFIGQCSIRHHKIILGKVGNSWVIAEFQTTYYFRAHYIINGKKVIMLHRPVKKKDAMTAYEYQDRSKPLSKMSADEIFEAAKNNKPARRHSAKMKWQTKFANGNRMER